MGEKNDVTIALMRQKKYFADAFNQYLYHGEQKIKPEQLTDEDSRVLMLDDKAGDAGKRMTIERFRDILKCLAVKKDDRAYYVLLGMEDQTEPDQTMSVRTLVYDALGLDAQLQDWKEHPERRGKLMPVVTLVIYFGDREWPWPLNIEALYDCDDPEILKFALRYRLNLIDPHRMTDEELSQFETNLGALMAFFKDWKNTGNPWQRLRKLTVRDPRFKSLEQPIVDVIDVFTDHKLGLPVLGEGETLNLGDYIEQDRREVRAEGMAEGVAKGIAETLDKVIRGLKAKGVALSDIAEVTGKPVEYVQSL